jgi:hypothetical protein
VRKVIQNTNTFELFVEKKFFFFSFFNPTPVLRTKCINARLIPLLILIQINENDINNKIIFI